jgi:hypothetical protein
MPPPLPCQSILPGTQNSAMTRFGASVVRRFGLAATLAAARCRFR